MRSEELDHSFCRVVWEDRHIVHTGEASEEFSPFLSGDERPRRALASSSGSIVIHRDNENIAKPAGSLQGPKMPHVEEIEVPVRQHDPLPSSAELVTEYCEIIELDSLAHASPTSAAPRHKGSTRVVYHFATIVRLRFINDKWHAMTLRDKGRWMAARCSAAGSFTRFEQS
jgi:hypothetical protein